MRVLLDTDIILDLLLERPDFVDDAAEIWKANEQERFQGFVSAITPVNLFYIARKLKGQQVAQQAVKEVLANLAVCPLDKAVLQNALALPLTDYEDAVQHASATASQIDVIVTRNLEDYRGATLTVLSPKDFLARLNKQGTG